MPRRPIARFLGILMTLAATLPLGRPAAAGDATSPATAPQVHHLPNGLTLVALENHAHPVIALSAFVTTGSRTEEGKWSGSLHYLEHLVYKGNTRNYKPTEFRKRIAEIGAEAGGWTWNDEINFGFETPRENFRAGLAIFTESLCELVFEPKWFEDEKQVVIQELEKYEEQPDHILDAAWDRLAWTRHPYGQEVGGTIPNIRNLDLHETERYYRERFTPNHVVLCAAGDFTQTEIVAWVRAEWDRMKPGPDSFELGIVEPPQPDARQSIVRTKYASTARLAVGFRTVPGAHADTPALLVLAELLNSATVGLPRYLVTDHKWVRWVAAGHTCLRDDGCFKVSAELEPAHARTVLAWIQAHLLGLDLARIEDRTLDEARRRLLTARAVARETCAEQVVKVGFEFERLGAALGLSLDERIRTVQRADLERAWKTCARPEKLVSVLVLPAEAQPGAPDPAAIDHAPRREPELPRLDVPAPEAAAAPPAAQVIDGIHVHDAPGAHWVVRQESVRPVKDAVRDDRGARVVVLPDRGSPLVSVSARVLGGQWVEPPGQAGINRLTARLLLRGTRTLGPTELDALLSHLALDLAIDHRSGSRANTARNVDYRDSANLDLVTLPETLPQALVLLRELLFHPRFDAEEFAKVKADTLDEIKTLPEDRLEFVKQEFYARAYAGHPYGRPTIGTADDVGRLTVDDVRAFHRAAFVPARVVLAVAGPVDPAAVFALVDAAWGEDPAALAAAAPVPGPPALALDAPVPEDAGRQVLDVGANQWTINFGRPSLACGDPRLPAARLLFRTLGNRHFYKYVYGEGVSYRSWFNFWGHLGPSPWIVENDLQKARFDAMLESISKDIETYAVGGLSDDEIERTRRRVLSGIILARQRGLDNAWFLAVAAGNERAGRGRGVAEYARLIPEISAVTPDQVRALARELLSKPYLRLIIK